MKRTCVTRKNFIPRTSSPEIAIKHPICFIKAKVVEILKRVIRLLSRADCGRIKFQMIIKYHGTTSRISPDNVEEGINLLTLRVLRTFAVPCLHKHLGIGK